MKTILVGDLHLKVRLILAIVSEKIEEFECEQVIFMGDYTDDWNCNMNQQLYLDELEFLINWKDKMKAQGVNVVTLLGNHDAPYLTGNLRHYSLQQGYQLISESLFKLGTQIAFQMDDFLVSHAGYCWGQELEEWHLRTIEKADSAAINLLERQVGIGRGGRYWSGSPLWADYRELMDSPNPKYLKQIVGHTPQKEILLENAQDKPFEFIAIDTFNLASKGEYPYYNFRGNGDLLLYNSGELSVIETEWQQKETLEKLYLQRSR